MKLKNNPIYCLVCGGNIKVIFTGMFDDRYGAPGKHSIYQCTICGFSQTYPGLSKSQIGKFYAKYYPLTQVVPSEIVRNPKPINKYLAWILGLGHVCHWQTIPGQSVLDIGCGSCRSLVEIEALGGISYGVEPDPTAQKITKKFKLKVHQGFITDDPFKGKHFDLVTATQVIEHDTNPVLLFQALKHKLKSSGRLVISTPNLDSIMRYIWGKNWLHWHIPYHLSFFTKKSIFVLADRVGLKVVKYKTVTPNLWAILQWKTFSARTSEGKPNQYWDGTRSLYNSKIAFAKMHAVAFILCRVLDLFGQGESLVITLESK